MGILKTLIIFGAGAVAGVMIYNAYNNDSQSSKEKSLTMTDIENLYNE